jgi:phosphopantetheinyl transferase
MSLFLKRFTRDAAIGVWEISESVEDLYAQVTLSDQEKEYFSCLKSPLRQQHWLSYRLILPYLIRQGELSTIEYDEYGKPHLNNGVRHISVAHSGKFSALIASPSKNVGIDIEQMHPKIFKVSHKFLNDRELTQVFSMNAKESLYLIWAAKEALYKLYGKRDLLFREHIRIFPFHFHGKGSIFGEIISGNGAQKSYRIQYETINDYILVYAVDN